MRSKVPLTYGRFATLTNQAKSPTNCSNFKSTQSRVHCTFDSARETATRRRPTARTAER
ncbi:hypothetical protein PUN28_003346 [Cardiocondyla obscurior]|uniref:Uncharacterized protein n=1 Tax=Cardiocondyla obscurior TaxID=286306 RepID=A0AAW2GK37_9HYME